MNERTPLMIPKQLNESYRKQGRSMSPNKYASMQYAWEYAVCKYAWEARLPLVSCVSSFSSTVSYRSYLRTQLPRPRIVSYLSIFPISWSPEIQTTAMILDSTTKAQALLLLVPHTPRCAAEQKRQICFLVEADMS